jgi:two-component system CheB/CheR fusion protein
MTSPIPDRPSDLAAIVDSAGDAVIGTTLDGVITSWNGAAQRLFGYTADEVTGRSISLITPPDRAVTEADAFARTLGGALVDHFETTRIARDGERIEISLALSPVRSATGEIIGISHSARDLRESRRLDEARGRLAAIVDSSDDAIVSKTLDGIITSWNRGAERLFGFTAAEAIGQAILLIIPSDRRPEEAEVLARIRRGEVVNHYETVRRRKDGSLVDISLTVSPVRDLLGRIIGASKIARDITERKRAVLQIARLYEEARQANRAKDEFLAMLGHELRNPLGAISHAVRLLADVQPDGSPAAHARDVIARQSVHLARLVDDLLDVGRVMTGKILLDVQPVDLAEIAERTVAMFASAGRTQQHRVTTETTPVWIDADAVRLEQVVGNLLTNALKYTPREGTIRVTVGPEGRDAVLRVEDSGTGIPAHLLPHIFDLFVQGERHLDRAQGGLGIGLTLVQRLASLHGGSVEAFSPGPGRGSRFTVRLPAVRQPPRRVDERPPERTPAESATRRRILIVEDNQDSRDMLHYVLAGAGHEVHEAADGAEGLDAALRLRPDVALVDVGLPRLDGYEVARRIRATPERHGMLLVALTGYGLVEDRDRALRAGFDLHLVKPVDPEKLLAVLRVPSPC